MGSRSTSWATRCSWAKPEKGCAFWGYVAPRAWLRALLDERAALRAQKERMEQLCQHNVVRLTCEQCADAANARYEEQESQLDKDASDIEAIVMERDALTRHLEQRDGVILALRARIAELEDCDPLVQCCNKCDRSHHRICPKIAEAERDALRAQLTHQRAEVLDEVIAMIYVAHSTTRRDLAARLREMKAATCS